MPNMDEDDIPKVPDGEEAEDLTKEVEELTVDNEESDKVEDEDSKSTLYDQWIRSLESNDLFKNINVHPKLQNYIDSIADESEIFFSGFRGLVKGAREFPDDYEQQMLIDAENNPVAMSSFLADYDCVFESGVSDLSVFKGNARGELPEHMREFEDEAMEDDEEFRKIGPSEMYLLMARQLEALFGNYADLLVWYYRNRQNKKWNNFNDHLKFFTADLLFGTNFGHFETDYLLLLTLIMNDEFISEYEKLKDTTQRKIKADTYTQIYIVNRLDAKAQMDTLYGEGAADIEYIVPAMRIVNRLELRSYGMDPDTMMAIEEKSASKSTDETSRM